MLKNKWLLLLLIAVFIKGAIWILWIPIFQVPDEPSHLSYIQLLAERGRAPLPRREVVSSRELFSAAEIVKFNWQIIHPVWQGYSLDWQNQLKLISQDSRREFSDNQNLTSLKRPGLYYYLSTGIYFLFSWGNFFWRFYALRFFSLLFHLITVFFVYLTAKKIINNPALALAAAAWAGFQPGLSFISSGITYESLAVLTATIFFYFKAANWPFKYQLAVALVGLFVKPDLIFLLLLLPRMWLIAPLLLIGFSALAPVVDQTIRGGYPWLNQWLYLLPLKDFSVFSREAMNLIVSGRLPGLLLDYFWQFIAVHYHQIFPWYWGVFGWLEKTLPPLTYTALKLVGLAAAVGLAQSWEKIRWLIGAVLVQAAVVIANDMVVFSQTGELYGIQGRYFYPAISVQMILLTMGLSHWLKPKWLMIMAIGLNLIGLLSVYQYFGWVWGK